MRCLFALPLALMAAALAAAPVEHAIDVQPRSCQVGDHIEINVTLITEPGVLLGQARLAETGEDLAVVGSDDMSPAEELSDGRTRRVWHTVLSPFTPGGHALPAVSVPWTVSEGGSGQIVIDLGSVTVASVLPEGLVFPGPKAPHGPFLMDEERPLWPWLTGLGAALALALAAWLWRRRGRGERPTAAPREPVRPPHEVALEELRALEPLLGDLANSHRVLFYGLTDTVRVYFDREFGIGAPEMTSEELNAALADANFPAEICNQMRHWTAACDLVKYASQRPRSEHGQRAIALARAIVVASHQHLLAQRASAEAQAVAGQRAA